MGTVEMIGLRANEMRQSILRMGIQAKGGHLAPALSCADIVSALYFGVMHYDATNPHWDHRDRFILSAGHKAAVLYAALASAGLMDPGLLDTYLQSGSPLAGHPDATRVPGVEVSTGSLGHGLAVASGIALGARRRQNDFRTFVLLSEGECQEGSTWEAAMSAAHFQLDHLVAIVDFNHLNTDGTSEAVMNLAPLADKWTAFGWSSVEVDGHDVPKLLEVLETIPRQPGKPTAVIAHTLKGKGFPAVEGRWEWHTGYPSESTIHTALDRLKEDAVTNGKV